MESIHNHPASGVGTPINKAIFVFLYFCKVWIEMKKKKMEKKKNGKEK